MAKDGLTVMITGLTTGLTKNTKFHRNVTLEGPFRLVRWCLVCPTAWERSGQAEPLQYLYDSELTDPLWRIGPAEVLCVVSLVLGSFGCEASFHYCAVNMIKPLSTFKLLNCFLFLLLKLSRQSLSVTCATTVCVCRHLICVLFTLH